MVTEDATSVARRFSRLSLVAVLFFAGVVIVGAVLGLGLLHREPLNLELTIHMDTTEFAPGDPIVVHGRLVNSGDVPIKIFTPAVADRTFEVIVHDDERHRYAKAVPYYRGMKPQRAPSEIRPGQVVSVNEDIRSGYGIVPGRRYGVRAAYRTLDFPDEDVLYGIIKSNLVYIFVKDE